jgi:hypothetical protein
MITNSQCGFALCPFMPAVAPPGFLMISSMVAPCGKGTFSSNYSNNYVPCTKCSTLKGAGITTESAGAASAESCTCEWCCCCCFGSSQIPELHVPTLTVHCKKRPGLSYQHALLHPANFCTEVAPVPSAGVEPGYAAVSDKGQVYLTGAAAGSIIAGAKPCPQDYYCSGGSPFQGGAGVPTRCPDGLRTQNEGAFSADQCGEFELQLPTMQLFCVAIRQAFCNTLAAPCLCAAACLLVQRSSRVTPTCTVLSVSAACSCPSRVLHRCRPGHSC